MLILLLHATVAVLKVVSALMDMWLIMMEDAEVAVQVNLYVEY